jgi:hypothetical protein
MDNQQNLEFPNIVQHVGELIATRIEQAQQSHREGTFHRIEMDQVDTPWFSIGKAPTYEIMEYPNMTMRNGVFRWDSNVARVRQPEMQVRLGFPPPGTRIHRSIASFVDSVFNRLHINWNQMHFRGDGYDSDENDEMRIASLFVRVVTRTMLPDDSFTRSASNCGWITISEEEPVEENHKRVKIGILKVLEDLAQAMWVPARYATPQNENQ